MMHESDMDSRSTLDGTAARIVSILRQDGRTPYATIARRLGLSEAGVRQRVQRMLDAGSLRIVAITDPARIGLTRQAMVGVTVSGDSQVVAAQLAELPEVTSVVTTIGRYDLLVEVVCVDDAHLVDLLQTTIRQVAGVIATETFSYLKINRPRHG